MGWAYPCQGAGVKGCMDVGGKVEINLDTLVLLESPHQFFSPQRLKMIIKGMTEIKVEACLPANNSLIREEAMPNVGL